MSDETDDLRWWPNCATPDCHNKVCRWAGTGHCHPCSERIVGAIEMEKRYLVTHDENGEWTGAVAA